MPDTPGLLRRGVSDAVDLVDVQPACGRRRSVAGVVKAFGHLMEL
ncbi:MAG TPA: hypothetical protein VFP43_04405 [Mesorhizobium sp.]|nr:hypothetical protein [Mesorhizobium sp.]